MKLIVRNVDQYKSGHMPNAINIPSGQLLSRIKSLNSYKQNILVAYCSTGSRSIKAANMLARRRFKNIYYLIKKTIVR